MVWRFHRIRVLGFGFEWLEILYCSFSLETAFYNLFFKLLILLNLNVAAVDKLKVLNKELNTFVNVNILIILYIR